MCGAPGLASDLSNSISGTTRFNLPIFHPTTEGDEEVAHADESGAKNSESESEGDSDSDSVRNPPAAVYYRPMCCCGFFAPPPHGRLVPLDEAEPYNRGNPYIHTGYRVRYDLKLTLRSLLFLHNEWANVWTHLSALIGFFFLMFYAYSTWLADGSFSDKATFLIWVISAQTLLFSSSFFHLTECMGPKVWLIGVRMDYTSISVLIVGSYFPMIHYLFACHSGWQYFYIGLMLALGVLVVSISMSNYFQKPEFQALRASLYVAMGLFGALCAPHVYILSSSEELAGLMPVCIRLALMGGTYIVGAYIYATKIPEKWFPGKFDYWWHSHMIWHIFVVAATMWHYSAVYHAHEWRTNFPCAS